MNIIPAQTNQQPAQTTTLPPIESVILEWLYQKQITNSGSPKTQRAYSDTMSSLREALQRCSLDVFSALSEVARVIPLWAAESKRSDRVADSTYNQRIDIIGSFYSFVRDTYHIENFISPIAGLKRRKVQKYAYAEPMSEQEIKKRLDKIDRSTDLGMRDYLILAIGLLTGRRAAELVGLRWGDVKISEGKITLQFNCKGGEVAKDRLPDEISSILVEYLGKSIGEMPNQDTPIWISSSRRNKGEAISIHTLRSVCLKYLGTTKIHTLRHTFARTMMDAGASSWDIKERLRHKRLETTEKYLQAISSDENKFASELARKFGIGG